ncbi:MAG: lipopolysaccharide heptosyltransferase II [Candidatus Omnitrophica bacterium]|nr:lipopolysaccharide heptosyltransferase II [Candidatus Omnitrophota bacterium]
MTSRLLIINQNWLGDVLFSTPAIRALRKAYPQSFIACLVPARCREVLENNPHLNEVIVYDDRAPVFSPAFWRLAGRLRRGAFTRAFFFHRSGTKTLLAFAAGIPERYGYGVPGRRRCLTATVPSPAREVHKIDFFLNLLEPLGVPSAGRAPDFFPDPSANAKLQALLNASGIGPGDPYVVAHAGGNWELKRWPADYFVRWIRLFLAKFPWRVVLCGTASEQGISDAIAGGFDSRQVTSLCGRTSLGELALLLRRAKFLLSNDSGPIHLAASQGTPVLGLYGPTSARLTGPVSDGTVRVFQKDVGCAVPCYFRSCDARVCMEWLSPEEVFAQTLDLAV